MSTKLEKLVELALSGESQLCIKTTVFGLNRLDDGMLSHIGDALIDGNCILCDGFEFERLAFTNSAHEYTIKPETITVNGVEINAPYREMPEVGTDYYYPQISVNDCTASGKVLTKGNPYDKTILDADLMFKTREDGKAYVKAIGWVR